MVGTARCTLIHWFGYDVVQLLPLPLTLLMQLCTTGTGLHTFVLYLGPFIASTTLAITECNTLKVDRYGPNQ